MSDMVNEAERILCLRQLSATDIGAPVGRLIEEYCDKFSVLDDAVAVFEHFFHLRISTTGMRR